MSRMFSAGILVAALALAAPPIFSQDAAPAAPASHPHRAWPKPTNLQVLPKDISHEELIATMRGFAGALGVKCGFCHAENPATHKLDFASDAKEDKNIARIMIRMTQTINGQYMPQVHDPDAMPEDKHVSCGTCHRGHQMPTQFVPPPEEHHGPPPAPSAPGA